MAILNFGRIFVVYRSYYKLEGFLGFNECFPDVRTKNTFNGEPKKPIVDY